MHQLPIEILEKILLMVLESHVTYNEYGFLVAEDFMPFVVSFTRLSHTCRKFRWVLHGLTARKKMWGFTSEPCVQHFYKWIYLGSSQAHYDSFTGLLNKFQPTKTQIERIIAKNQICDESTKKQLRGQVVDVKRNFLQV